MSKIFRPKKGTDIPDAPGFDPETGQRLQVDKREALSQWLKSSRQESKAEDESYSVTIDPKQAAYATKRNKNKEK